MQKFLSIELQCIIIPVSQRQPNGSQSFPCFRVFSAYVVNISTLERYF